MGERDKKEEEGLGEVELGTSWSSELLRPWLTRKDTLCMLWTLCDNKTGIKLPTQAT